MEREWGSAAQLIGANGRRPWRNLSRAFKRFPVHIHCRYLKKARFQLAPALSDVQRRAHRDTSNLPTPSGMSAPRPAWEAEDQPLQGPPAILACRRVLLLSTICSTYVFLVTSSRTARRTLARDPISTQDLLGESRFVLCGGASRVSCLRSRQYTGCG